ncbi:YfhO family protein [Actinomarinicola tropica]|uniref:YfhO family protein n=1 Tax=Actinomarinicola tropica TaxID=2789776 RepID=A0A5Q2RGC8_9ACTN|nr:YfhO family protein [Actinomarinicola tropica]QGG95858.1 YfhO family protein [Actinomarinicola tropica]
MRGRLPSWDRWWPALLIAVVIALAIGGPLLGGAAFHGVGLTANVYPWKATASLPELLERFPPIFDTIDGSTPALIEFARQAREGDLSLWVPWEVGGRPHGGFPGIAYWTPWVLPWLVLPPWLAPAWTKALEMAVAAGATFAFCRRVGMGRLPATTGGVAFALSGFMTVWTNWPHTLTAAVIPVVFWAAERAIQERTWASLGPLALAGAWMFLSGFPAVAVFAVMTLVPYVVARLWMDASGGDGWRQQLTTTARRLAPIAAGGVGAVGLSAFALVPWARRMQGIDLGYREGLGQGSLPPSGLLTLPFGGAFGLDGGPYWGPRNIMELNAFVGVGAVFLAIVAVALLSRHPRRVVVVLFALAAVTWTLVIFTDLPPARLIRSAPLLSSNGIGRARSVLGFVMAVLAAAGLDALSRSVADEVVRSRERLRLLGGVVVATVAVAAAAVASRGRAADADQLGEWGSVMLVPGLLVLVAVGGLVVVALAGRRTWIPRVALVALLAVVAVDGTSFAHRFWPTTSRDRFFEVTPTHEFLDDHLGLDRFAAAGNTMWPGSQVAYPLRGATGHTFHADAWSDLLATADPRVMRTPTHSVLAVDAAVVSSPVLDRLAVRYFVANPEEPPLGDLVDADVASGSQVTLVPDRPLPLRWVEGDRGVVLAAAAPSGVSPEAVVEVELLDEDGNRVDRGWRRLFGAVGNDLTIVVPEVDGVTRATLTLRSPNPADAIDLTAVDGDVAPSARVVGGDDLRVVTSEGTPVYERLSVRPRFSWATSAEVLPDAGERLAALSAGLDDQVVAVEVPVEGLSAGDAAIDVTTDDGDTIDVEVDAEAAGMLVVAESFEDGWSATLDGEAVALVRVDHALMGVVVPEGRHDLALRFEPPGRQVGMAVTGATAVLLVAVAVAGRPRGAISRR